MATAARGRVVSGQSYRPLYVYSSWMITVVLLVTFSSDSITVVCSSAFGSCSACISATKDFTTVEMPSRFCSGMLVSADHIDSA